MNKNRNCLRVATIIFIICFSVACMSSIIRTEAATHTHSEQCYTGRTHVHTGSKHSSTGCYRGPKQEQECGTGSWASGSGLDQTTNSPTGGGTVFYVMCNGCNTKFPVGAAGGGNWTRPAGVPNAGTPTNGQIFTHYASLSTLNCGYDAGDVEIPAVHIHEGSMNTKGGCYGGTGVYIGECTGTFEKYLSTGGYCGDCDASFSIVVYVCNTCNYGETTGGHKCANNNWQYTGTAYEGKKHEGNMYKYEVVCDKEEGWYYYVDGTSANKTCNKKINSITAKTKSQLIIR